MEQKIGSRIISWCKMTQFKENPETWAIDPTLKAGVTKLSLSPVLGSLLLMNSAEFNSNLDLPACF